MSSHFRAAARKDKNHNLIAEELTKLGARVDDVSRLKKLYDMVVTWRMLPSNEVRTVRVEIKQPSAELTPDEKEYHAADLYPETLIIAHTTEEVMAWFGR